MQLRRPTFFLLDLDGTLVRFSWLDPNLQSERRKLHELAQSLDLKPAPGMLFPALLALGRERPGVQAALEAIELRAAESSTVCPGAPELLAALAAAPTAIVTNNGRHAVRAALRCLRPSAPAASTEPALSGLPLVCRDDVSRPKPDPEPFLLALDRLRQRFGEPASVLVLGDSLADLHAARALAAARGLDVTAVGVEGGVGTAEDLRAAGAAHVFPSLHDLLARLTP
jgi:phosphoglycolate phosphatase-like HAD superfamily hydrolase